MEQVGNSKTKPYEEISSASTSSSSLTTASSTSASTSAASGSAGAAETSTDPRPKRMRRNSSCSRLDGSSTDDQHHTFEKSDLERSHMETTSQQKTLLTQYEVVRRILSNLPSWELHRVRAVCSVWKAVANILLKQRRIGTASSGPPVWDTEPVPKGEHTRETAARLARRLLSRCYYEPKTALFFQSLRCSKGRRKSVPPLEKLLPYPCFVGGVTSLTGCVATSAEGLPVEDQSSDRIGLLLLPRPKLPTQVGAAILRVRTPAPPESLMTQLPVGVWDSLRAGLIFFSSRRGMHAADALTRAIQEAFDGTVALAGGWVDLITPKSPPDAVLFVYFSGRHVDAASVVVNDDSRDLETLDTEQAASLLGSQKLPSENSLAFMIACCGRGEYEFEPGYESAVLARHIPGVPVFGAFVNGELGSTALVENDAASQQQQQRHLDHSMIMSYTTVFLQVQFMNASNEEEEATWQDSDSDDSILGDASLFL